jgi:DUF1009 family protein
MEYGLGVARHIAAMDLGQTVVVRDRACVAIEAMEGTDETIERAARITGGAELTVVKVSKPGQDMRFDRPAIGPATVELLAEIGAAMIGVEAGIALILERDRTLELARAKNVTIFGYAEPNG